MVFFEAVQALASLDLSFFVDLVLNNIFWVFAFYVMIYIFFEGKKTVHFFLLWGFLLWAILDWEYLTGMAFSGSMFLLVYYISKLSLLGFAESTPGLKKYLVVISTLQAYSIIWLYSFFIGGG